MIALYDIFDFLSDMKIDLTWYQKVLIHIIDWITDLHLWIGSHHISHRTVWELTIKDKDDEYYESILFFSRRQMMRFWRMNDSVYKQLGLHISSGGGVPVYRRAFQMECSYTDDADNTPVLDKVER